MKNIFLRDDSFYKRDLNPFNQYIEQAAYYLSKVKNISTSLAKDKIKDKIKTRQFKGMRDPTVQFYERHNYEDRVLTEVPLTNFLMGIGSENLTMAPSLTCYVPSSERESLLSGFTDENVRLRNIAKKEAAKFKALGDLDKHRHFNGEQENKKLYNNSLSGAFSSGGSIVRNPTAHSSLTSTTRTMTSIGNASNERLISGNRHYRNPSITLNNIVVLAQTADSKEIRKIIDFYRLKIPTVQDVMNCIEYSTQLYWNDFKYKQKILDFVNTLTDEERCSVVYTGDLYQLRLLNEDFVRNFLTKISLKVSNVSYDDPISIIKKTDEMYVNYVHQICLSEVRGIGKDYTLLTKQQQDIVAGTCVNLQTVLENYQDLIKTFFLTSNLPCSVAYIRDSIRRSVVLSDTDSTMFSCDEWVQWYFNEIKFTDEAFAVSGAVMFLATQCIAHNLAIYSANLNVERKKLFMASMKPEFTFGVFALTSAGKHYYTNIVIKEGSVYKKPEIEIKGVYLKSSASPRPIMVDVKKMMEMILDIPVKGNRISLNYWIKHVANIEREIERSVLAGENTYLGRLNIKVPDAYKVPAEMSNYRYHLLWNEVFSPKYGVAPQPTYTCVKFPTLLSSSKALLAWLSTIEDEGLKSRMSMYLERTQRKDLNTLYIPQDIVQAWGTPKEIQGIIDIKSLILMHLGAHRMVLESIGFFSKEGVTLTEMGY